MMTLVLTVLAVLTSLTVLLLLRYNDPKRRRVLKRRHQRVKGRTVWLWSAAFIPGPILIGVGDVSAFLCWFASLTVIGWILAWHAPSRGKDE